MTAQSAQLPTANFRLPKGSEAQIPQCTVECVDDAWGFTALGPCWNELLRTSDSDNPFLTWEWLNAWWSHFAGASRLQLIVVRAGGELIAVAPLRLITTPLYWFSRLEFLGTGEAGSDYLDLIVKRGLECEVIAAMSQFLASQKQTMRLTHLPPASLGARLADSLADSGWVYTPADDGVCPYIRLGGHTFESFLDSLGASHRANIRRRIRALERRFTVRFARVTSHAARLDMLAALARFHGARYDARGGSTAFGTAAARAFHEDATARALERGWLRMYALHLDDDLAAVMYGFHYGGRFYFYQHGHDEKYASHSVGLVLMSLTIRAALDEGAHEFDLLWGAEAYKSLWARESRVLARADLFPVDLEGTVQRHAVGVRRGVTQFARRVLSPWFSWSPS